MTGQLLDVLETKVKQVVMMTLQMVAVMTMQMFCCNEMKPDIRA